MVIVDQYKRTWQLIERKHLHSATRWIVYCDSQCLLITQDRRIALAWMPTHES